MQYQQGSKQQMQHAILSCDARDLARVRTPMLYVESRRKRYCDLFVECDVSHIYYCHNLFVLEGSFFAVMGSLLTPLMIPDDASARTIMVETTIMVEDSDDMATMIGCWHDYALQEHSKLFLR